MTLLRIAFLVIKLWDLTFKDQKKYSDIGTKYIHCVACL